MILGQVLGLAQGLPGDANLVRNLTYRLHAIESAGMSVCDVM